VFRQLLGQAVSLLRKMAKDFPQLQERYRAAHADLTSVEQWGKAFESWGYERL
jgi:galactofuranosylgalactofuranosylrhamnosyl-N-acetylglucosaminyl-diphospho-decaprenol beta-1,5/1,6-galactofuranosyltransferase